MPTRKTKPASAPAARFGGGESSVSVNFSKAPHGQSLGDIGTKVLTPEEVAALEQKRQAEHERQQRAVVPGVGGPQVLTPLRYGGRSYDKPEPPKLTAKQLKELAEAEAAKQREREATAAYNAKIAAEKAIKQKAAQAIQQEQAEKARLAHEERYKAQWGDRGGASVVLRKDSPSFKGKR